MAAGTAGTQQYRHKARIRLFGIVAVGIGLSAVGLALAFTHTKEKPPQIIATDGQHSPPQWAPPSFTNDPAPTPVTVPPAPVPAPPPASADTKADTGAATGWIYAGQFIDGQWVARGLVIGNELPAAGQSYALSWGANVRSTPPGKRTEGEGSGALSENVGYLANGRQVSILQVKKSGTKGHVWVQIQR